MRLFASNARVSRSAMRWARAHRPVLGFDVPTHYPPRTEPTKPRDSVPIRTPKQVRTLRPQPGA